jgi:LmbE family N-acetylglucosaminyl deacetylase
MPLAEEEIERILVVTAHPDDVDFGVAGSVGVWTDKGIEVTYCIVTDGDAGGFDPAVLRSEIAGIRRAEQTAAAEQVGVTDLAFLGHPDGRLYPTIEVRRDISRVIRRVRPQRVIAQSPERNYMRMYASHPDHMAAGEATLCAVYPDARNPFAHPELLEEGYEAWTVPEVWMMASGSGESFVDITPSIDRKIKALLCHASQMTNPDAMDELIRGWASANAAAAGLPEGHYAEAFRLIPTA